MSDAPWSENELTAYILLYCANADYIETKEEKDMIEASIDKAALITLRQEFEKDNDYQRIQKIIKGIEVHHYTDKEKENLFEKIKALFLADGEFDVLEKNVFSALHKLI